MKRLQGKQADDALAIQLQLEQGNARREGAGRIRLRRAGRVEPAPKRPDEAAKYAEKQNSLKRKP